MANTIKELDDKLLALSKQKAELLKEHIKLQNIIISIYKIEVKGLKDKLEIKDKYIASLENKLEEIIKN